MRIRPGIIGLKTAALAVAFALIAVPIKTIGTASAQRSDVVYLNDGTVRGDGVIVEEKAGLLRYRESGKELPVDIYADKVKSVEHYDPPDDYSVAMGYFLRRDYARAFEQFDLALKNYSPETQRPWVAQYCLYQMGRCRLLEGVLNENAAKLEEAAKIFERLVGEYENGWFKLIATDAAARAFADAAEIAGTPDAGKFRQSATASFTALEKAAADLLKGDAMKDARRDWTGRARAGKLSLELASGTLAHYQELSRSFGRVAQEVGSGSPVYFIARSGEVRCRYATARISGDKWDEAERAARALIDEIDASPNIRKDEAARLIVRLYMLIGDTSAERASPMPMSSPDRRALLLKAVGAYLRVPLLYAGVEDVAAEQARALYRGAQAFVSLEDANSARKLIASLKSRFANSEFWTKKADEALAKIP